jgi:GNAT superfamily N-acetyltransferase
MIDVSWFRPAGQFIALDGDVWAGVAAVGYTESRNLLYHNMTGVDRAYRGRGIASALKWATIAYAIETGAAVLETHNDSSNAPMLAINRAFGYRSEPGYSDLRRLLR